MEETTRPSWLRTALLVGGLYLLVGVATGALAGAAASSQMQFIWRLSAFVLSGAVFIGHLAYEHRRLHSAPPALAWHTSAAVAVGAFALALAANLHDLRSPAGYRPRMLVALVAWPVLTAVPAFVVAMTVAAGFIVKRRLDER